MSLTKKDIAVLIGLPALAGVIAGFWVSQLKTPLEKQRYTFAMLELGREIDIVTGKCVG